MKRSLNISSKSHIGARVKKNVIGSMPKPKRLKGEKMTRSFHLRNSIKKTRLVALIIVKK